MLIQSLKVQAESLSRYRLVERLTKYAILSALGFLFLYPLLYMVGTSLKTTSEVMAVPPTIFGSSLRFQNYTDVLERRGFLDPFLVTIVVVALNVLGNLISSAMAAFAFSHLRWPGRDIFFGISLSTLMVPYVLVMVPLFILWNNSGLIHTPTPDVLSKVFDVLHASNAGILHRGADAVYGTIPLWLIAWGGSIFDIFLLRQFFRTIPQEMLDAAEIDGANVLQIFMYIILPLSKPALIVITLFRSVFIWHDLLGPLLYLTGDSRQLFTLSQALERLQGTSPDIPPWQEIMAYSTLVTAPLILIFMFFQRHFVEGISLSGLKE